MELFKEKIEKIWVNKMEADEKIIKSNKRHKELKRWYKSSKHKGIQPVWHTDISKIDLLKQRDNFCEDLLVEEITIIDDVDIELLFDKMLTGVSEMFRKKVLYHKDLCDWKISDVLDKWLNSAKLIPPTIFVTDKTVDKYISNTNNIFPIDGKHRLNVAYYYGVTNIPIIVVKKRLGKIKTILNLK